MSVLVVHIIRRIQANSSAQPNNPQEKKKSISENFHQYLITTRVNLQVVRRSIAYITHTPLSTRAQTHQNLVSIEC